MTCECRFKAGIQPGRRFRSGGQIGMAARDRDRVHDTEDRDLGGNGCLPGYFSASGRILRGNEAAAPVSRQRTLRLRLC
jgi:hypothetical protein